MKETQIQAQTVYEKEVRRARKEAFKSSSALVNLQEELKTARNRYTLMRVDAEDQKQMVAEKEKELSAVQEEMMAIRLELDALTQQGLNARKENASATQQDLQATKGELDVAQPQGTAPHDQDAVAMQNELREVSEELFLLQQKLSKAERKIEKAEMQKQVIEEERNALKKSMEEEQVVKSAAQGAIALPQSRDTSGFLDQNQVGDIEARKHDRDLAEEMLKEPKAGDELLQLRDELRTEKQRRLEAEEQVHFSQMECQFGCCSCRLAEKQGKTFVHDGSLAAAMAGLSSASSAKSKSTVAKKTIPERPRSQQAPIRSGTPKLTMPQRPRSQQASAQHATPKLLGRPWSQQSECRRTTPRPYHHNRSVTETTFTTAKELDLQARRSISHARNTSATPVPPATSREFSERLIDRPLSGDKSKEEADADNENLLEIDFSSPLPQPPVAGDNTYSAIAAPSAQHTQPPSPTMDFNFTEIIPSFPSIPRPLPTPPPPTTNCSDIMFEAGSLTTASTTTVIPLKDDAPELFSPAPDTPGGISREAALEQIRARRGRARSYAASHGAPTPKKGITGTPRREISAPALKRV